MKRTMPLAASRLACRLPGLAPVMARTFVPVSKAEGGVSDRCETLLDDGPRRPAFSLDDGSVYDLCERGGDVIPFAIDRDQGTLSALDQVGTVPGAALASTASTATSGADTVAADDGRPKIRAAAIAMTPDGRFASTTERTKTRLAPLPVAPGTGKQTSAETDPTERRPHGIRIDRTGNSAVVTGKPSDRVSTDRIDEASGDPTLVGSPPVGRDADWVGIVDRP